MKAGWWNGPIRSWRCFHGEQSCCWFSCFVCKLLMGFEPSLWFRLCWLSSTRDKAGDPQVTPDPSRELHPSQTPFEQRKLVVVWPLTPSGLTSVLHLHVGQRLQRVLHGNGVQLQLAHAVVNLLSVLDQVVGALPDLLRAQVPAQTVLCADCRRAAERHFTWTHGEVSTSVRKYSHPTGHVGSTPHVKRSKRLQSRHTRRSKHAATFLEVPPPRLWM